MPWYTIESAPLKIVPSSWQVAANHTPSLSFIGRYTKVAIVPIDIVEHTIMIAVCSYASESCKYVIDRFTRTKIRRT